MSIVWAFRLLLFYLFSKALWHKLRQHQRFRQELSAYRLLPQWLIAPAAIILIVAESVCLLGLLFFPAALWLAVFLLLLYTVAICINLFRGHVDMDCGCGGWFSPPSKLSGWLPWRNGILILFASIAWFIPATHHHPFEVLLSALALIVLLEAFEQTLSNHQQHQFWLKRNKLA